jgi:F0F1-type ATP synthase gamma subunit
MKPLAQLKQELDFSSNLGGIIEVLKIAASVELKQLQSRSRDSSGTFLDSFQGCAEILETFPIQHPLLTDREHLPSCVVVVTFDEGFSGELNASLVDAALDIWKGDEGDELVVLGERGASYLDKLGRSFIFFPGIKSTFDRSDVEQLKTFLVDEYLKDRFGRVLIVYPRFIGMTSSRVATETLLPYQKSFTHRVSGSRKPSPRSSQPKAEVGFQLKQMAQSWFVLAKGGRIEQPIIEPSPDRVMGSLVHLWLMHEIRRIFMQSKLSEFSARLMHLEVSDQRLSRINRDLNLGYVKHLHALTDKSIREISVSRLKKRHAHN